MNGLTLWPADSLAVVLLKSRYALRGNNWTHRGAAFTQSAGNLHNCMPFCAIFKALGSASLTPSCSCFRTDVENNNQHTYAAACFVPLFAPAAIFKPHKPQHHLLRLGTVVVRRGRQRSMEEAAETYFLVQVLVEGVGVVLFVLLRHGDRDE